MIAETSLVIAGVKAVMDTFFNLKGSKSNKVKASLSINKALITNSGMALNVSITNNTDKPFSILEMFLQQDDQRIPACSAVEIIPQKTANRCVAIKFKASMFTINYTNQEDEYFDLNPFNLQAYLLQNQAETGWILFKTIPAKVIMNNQFGVKLSGSTEVLFAETL